MTDAERIKKLENTVIALEDRSIAQMLAFRVLVAHLTRMDPALHEVLHAEVNATIQKIGDNHIGQKIARIVDELLDPQPEN